MLRSSFLFGMSLTGFFSVTISDTTTRFVFIQHWAINPPMTYEKELRRKAC